MLWLDRNGIKEEISTGITPLREISSCDSAKVYPTESHAALNSRGNLPIEFIASKPIEINQLDSSTLISGPEVSSA